MGRKTKMLLRAGFATFLVSSVVGAVGVTPAIAAPFSGGFSPTIYTSLADLNGDGVADGADDSNALYGDAAIIDGALDCDAWAADNDGALGDGTIDANDDCTLIGVDGTLDGVTIDVVDGEFATADGAPIVDGTALPTVFNAADPDDPSVAASDFAWSAIAGRVDSSGDETIDGDDCSFDLVGDVDILGNPGANECGFATPPDEADNGLVDLNEDQAITDDDTCIDGCFFGLDVIQGFVTDSDCTIIGTSGADILGGTAGADVMCGLGGDDRLVGHGGADVIRGGVGDDRLVGRGGADVIRGGAGDDRLVGRAGNDLIKGGDGDDLMKGNIGRDRLFGDAGPDTAFGGRGNDRCGSARIQRGCER